MDYNSRLSAILNKPANRICADCNSRNPRWASISLGVFVCIRCCGIHRKLGTHISKMKSCTLDRWTQEMFYIFESLDNDIANDYWENRKPGQVEKLIDSSSSHIVERYLRDKYERRLWTPQGAEDLVKRVLKGETVRNVETPQPETTKPQEVNLLEDIDSKHSQSAPRLQQPEWNAFEHAQPQPSAFPSHQSSDFRQPATQQFPNPPPMQSSANPPQSSGNFPQNPTNFPQNAVNFPQNPTSFPQNPTNFPQNTGNFPQNTGNFPQNTGNFPQNTGNFPQNTGNFPQNTGNFPQNTGNFPQNPANFPQGGANFPQNPQNVANFPNAPQNPGFPANPANPTNMAQPGMGQAGYNRQEETNRKISQVMAMYQQVPQPPQGNQPFQALGAIAAQQFLSGQNPYAQQRNWPSI